MSFGVSRNKLMPPLRLGQAGMGLSPSPDPSCLAAPPGAAEKKGFPQNFPLDQMPFGSAMDLPFSYWVVKKG